MQKQEAKEFDELPFSGQPTFSESLDSRAAKDSQQPLTLLTREAHSIEGKI